MKANWKNSGVLFQQFLAALIALLLAGNVGALAQEKPAPKAGPLAAATTKAASPSKTVTADKEESRGGPLEGIKVHGHWSIVVKNADGSIASRNEFENALVSGSTLLGEVLARNYVIGRWSVVLLPSGTQPPLDIEEPGGSLGPCGGSLNLCNPLPQIFSNLTVSDGNGTGQTVLQGTATASNALTITTVQSWVTACPRPGPGYALPASCGDSLTTRPVVFTAATLTNPQAVAAGQIVQVTVTFSFS